MAHTRNYAGFSMFLLKIVALLSMLASHVAIVFEPEFSSSTLSLMRYFGLIAFPVFAFSLANGWCRTHSRLLYVLRIFAMALFAQAPFAIALKGIDAGNLYGAFFCKNLNIGFTFLLAIVCLIIYDMLKKIEFPKPIALLVAILPAVAFEVFTTFHVDYGYRGVLLILIMYSMINDKPMFFMSSAAVLAWMSASISKFVISIYTDVFFVYLVSMLLILMYNGNRGAKAKYLFYIFYPLHLIILLIIKLYII